MIYTIDSLYVPVYSSVRLACQCFTCFSVSLFSVRFFFLPSFFPSFLPSFLPCFLASFLPPIHPSIPLSIDLSLYSPILLFIYLFIHPSIFSSECRFHPSLLLSRFQQCCQFICLLQLQLLLLLLLLLLFLILMLLFLFPMFFLQGILDTPLATILKSRFFENLSSTDNKTWKEVYEQDVETYFNHTLVQYVGRPIHNLLK